MHQHYPPGIIFLTSFPCMSPTKSTATKNMKIIIKTTWIQKLWLKILSHLQCTHFHPTNLLSKQNITQFYLATNPKRLLIILSEKEQKNSRQLIPNDHFFFNPSIINMHHNLWIDLIQTKIFLLLIYFIPTHFLFSNFL